MLSSTVSGVMDGCRLVRGVLGPKQRTWDDGRKRKIEGDVLLGAGWGVVKKGLSLEQGGGAKKDVSQLIEPCENHKSRYLTPGQKNGKDPGPRGLICKVGRRFDGRSKIVCRITQRSLGSLGREFDRSARGESV